jgi:H/ACA ribonucleoprotein complex subunit 3
MDKSGQIAGYTMPLLKNTEPLLRYSDRAFRQSIATQTIIQIFQDLHTTLSKLHFARIIIGDFNDLNILIKGTEAYLIDADSFQFNSFLCSVFTARFVDPLLCHQQATQLILQKSHNADSDWYAFTIMLMQCLLFVDPYGGIYKPKQQSQHVLQATRPLHRITVFHPEVRYPKPAIPYKVLPDELLDHFRQVFEGDRRGEFPRQLLDELQWLKCQGCGIEHARSVCPNCTQAIAIQSNQVSQHKIVSGVVTATTLFKTEGVILTANVEQGKLQWVYHEQSQFKREDGSTVLNGSLNPHLRWRIQGRSTWLGYQGQLLHFIPEQEPERYAVDSMGAIAQFDTNQTYLYWLDRGQLLRLNRSSLFPLSSSLIGTVLPSQTCFWVGSHFGFGFYQADRLTIAFVFDVDKVGINDRVQLPRWQGQLIHANCSFSSDFCWLFLTTQEQGQIIHRCVVIQSNGAIAAMAQTRTGDDHWLTKIRHGQPCAIANFLLAATDEGILRVELQQGRLVLAKTFVETEPFVDSQCQLLPAPEGLYVVSERQIQKLKLY